MNDRFPGASALTSWRPLAHVAVRDDDLRRRLVDALRLEGWAVVDAPSGYHLVQRLAGPLLAEQPWRTPHLVVVEAASPGCSGCTIARGLRDLGWSVPVVLLAPRARTRRVALEAGGSAWVAAEETAVANVLEVARRQHRGQGQGARAPEAAPAPWDEGRAIA